MTGRRVRAGVSDDGQHRNTAFSFFQAEVELTSEGLAAGAGFGTAVAALFFQYLSMLRRAGAQQWVWDENRRLSDMRFRCAAHAQQASSVIWTQAHASRHRGHSADHERLLRPTPGTTCRFKQDHDAMDTVTQLASDMLVYAPHHVLVGGYLHERWDAHLVEQLVSLMAADREGMRLDVQTSDFDALKEAFATTFEARSEPLQAGMRCSSSGAGSYFV